MNYVYQAIPFIGKVKSGDSARSVSLQLSKAINENAVDGWEFYQLSEVNIEVSPGCLSSLFGAKESYVRFDQLIFRKQV